ncbi:MAG: L,D-transpeptidase family protein [Pseudorhodobacter sp.]
MSMAFPVPRRHSGILVLPLVLALAGCVPGQMASTPEAAARQAPMEPVETAYMSRADGGHAIPAVPLEKLPEPLRRQQIAYQTDLPPGSIVIHPGQKFLYFVTAPGKAIRYGISVGRAGFDWAGDAEVSRSRAWPTWTPPPEMIDRDPKLSKWKDGQPGGPNNPLGARAIYLTSNGRDYGYRIHGTPEWWTIGKRASSGCIRMIHQDVIDLNKRIQQGAQVRVLNADGSVATRLRVPPPAPKKKKPKPEVTTIPAAVSPVTGNPEGAMMTPIPSASESESPAAGAIDARDSLTAPVVPPSDSTRTAAPEMPSGQVVDPAPAADGTSVGEDAATVSPPILPMTPAAP